MINQPEVQVGVSTAFTRKGWAGRIRLMQIGDSVEFSCEREARSFVQTVRSCDFRYRSRKQADGSVRVWRLERMPPTEWKMVWRNGVQVRKRVVVEQAETTADDYRIPADLRRRLRGYCAATGARDAQEVIGKFVAEALDKFELLVE